jgi:hypothetical protein
MRLRTKPEPEDEAPAVPKWRLRAAPELQRADLELNEARNALIAAVRWVNELEHRQEKADRYRKLMDDHQLTIVEPERAEGPTAEEWATAREAVALRNTRLERALAVLEDVRRLPQVDAIGEAQRAGSHYIARKRFTYLDRNYVIGEPIDLSGLTPDKRREWIGLRLVEEVPA